MLFRYDFQKKLKKKNVKLKLDVWIFIFLGELSRTLVGQSVGCIDRDDDHCDHR